MPRRFLMPCRTRISRIWTDYTDWDMTELLYEEETYKIIGACLNVHKKLGNGFLESVYQEAVEKELTKQKLPYERQKRLQIQYEGEYLDKYFVADFLCFEKIILEIKAASTIIKDHTAQLLNYLKATGYSVGLLINFGETSLTWKRMINTPPKK